MNDHAYEPVDFGLWNVLKPYVKSDKVNKVVLLHIFGENGANAIFVTSDDKVYGTGSSLGLYLNLKLDCGNGQLPLVELTDFSHKLIKCFSSGHYFIIALTGDGRLLSSGRNNYGQLGVGVIYNIVGVCSVMIPPYEIIVSVQCGFHYSLALTSSNKVYEWGCKDIHRDECAKLTIPSLIKFNLKANICGIACYGYIYAALTQSGNIYIWENSGGVKVVTDEVSIMGVGFGGCVYIRHGNLYQSNKLIGEADDFVVHGLNICFKKGRDFFLKKGLASPKKVDVPNFQSAFANRCCPKFVRMSHAKAKALSTKKEIKGNRNIYEIFYNKKDISDLTIKLSNRVIFVHKTILIGLCDHFKQVLTGPWAASNSIEMDMTIYNPVAYETFLKYIYSGILHDDKLTGSDLIDLYSIAESYFEDDLKESVLEAFKNYLTIENVCQLYCLAVNQKQLVEECMKLACVNLCVIVASEGFNQMKAELAKKFVQNCSKRNLKK